MVNSTGKGEEDLGSQKLLALPCEKLKDHPLRLPFYGQDHLESLVSSISVMGLLEPVLIWGKGDDDYVILSGHYRVRALRRLKKKRTSCRVIACDRHRAHAIYCTSNLMTRELGALEESHIIAGLILQEGYTREEVARLWGKSKSWVCRRIKLLVDLDPGIKGELMEGRLLPRLAQELCRLPRGNEQERVLSLIKRYHLGKDDAASLIDWWLTANTDERLAAEKSDILPTQNSLKDKQRFKAEPGDRISTLMKRCSMLLSELIRYLGEDKGNLDLSSMAEYMILKETIDNFNCLACGGLK